MRVFCTILLAVFFISNYSFSQKDKWQDQELRAKFEELEKIKLIETLQMNEETTLRFFARRSEQKLQEQKLRDNIRANIDDLETMLNSGREVTSDDFKSKINEINDLEIQLEKKQVEFINSLPDILSYSQIAQLIVFEKRFRNEVRRLIMRDLKSSKDQK